jgi:alpha-glucosidase
MKLSFLPLLCGLLLAVAGCRAQYAPPPESRTEARTFSEPLLPDEHWYGGLSVDGHLMPYTSTSDIERNLYGNNAGNQAQPLLISDKGRYLWSEQPFRYAIKDGHIEVTAHEGLGELTIGTRGGNLREVYAYVSKEFFPSNGETPSRLLFEHPQYNTWIELIYDQEEEAILTYARSILDQGYPPGVLMIDDNWQEDYGDWRFSGTRFKDPKGMMDQLHEMGFKVMLWICPFVSADSDEFRYLAKNGMLLLDGSVKKPVGDDLWEDTQGRTAIIRWWNGASGLLDLSNPKTRDWFQAQMDTLVEKYEVDGFKLDAGDAFFYDKEDLVSFNESTPNDHTTYFAEIGLKYPLNEYRASWKMAGLPLVQRLRDKRHDWGDLQQLVPGIIAQGLMGYAYTCPDMIGGGAYTTFLPGSVIDEELVVRSAQTSALMPMMQFSVAPWRVLSEENNAICKRMALLHEEYGDIIYAMAEESAKTGEPIARSLDYNYPDGGFAGIGDQFMLGTELLVAPLTEKGARSREVVFPEGQWEGDDGSTVTGPATLTIQVPLQRLPYYRLVGK